MSTLAKLIILPVIIIVGIYLHYKPAPIRKATSPTPVSTATSVPTATGVLIKQVLIPNVPFTSQAPFGDWKDERQQDGCEEASAAMAVYWGQKKTLSKSQALEIILAASAYQLQKYGEYRDISTKDTLERIIRDYFNYPYAEYFPDISAKDIIEQLFQNKLVIVPTNGQLLGNPNFTGAGPERHMLVIRGYNRQTKEFITNDPGTRKGELYRYSEDVLFQSIRDYHTGYHIPITETRRNMIVVSAKP